MRTKAYYKMFHDASQAMLKHADAETVETLLKIRRLAKKHHRLAEMDCNGEGVIMGVHYYNGTIDDYAKRTYGRGVKTAYMYPGTEEFETVFDVESKKVQEKIACLVNFALGGQWYVEFQGDPRGNTVKLYHNKRYVDVNF